MEFDKSRVYTAVNADELKVGSKCVFADDLRELRRLVSIEDTSQVLIAIKGESYKYRFEQAKADCMGDTLFALAYLIEPPAEPKYKPFENLKQLIVATKKHGETVKSLVGQNESTIIGMTLNNRVIIDKSFSQSFGQPYGDKASCTTEELLYNFVFLSDNSPCGELVEE